MLENSDKIKPKVLAVCISDIKGTPKKQMTGAELRPDWGLVGDAHAASGKRQVSLLAIESINKMKEQGVDVGFGSFAENITTQGINLVGLPVGQKLRIGPEAILQVSQIGKECHGRCAVYYQIGDCIMPREGIFAAVIKGGRIKDGDKIEIL